MLVAAMTATADIGEPHQLRDHRHHVATAGAAHHAHDIAAAHAADSGRHSAASAHRRVAAVIGCAETTAGHAADAAAAHHAAEPAAAVLHHAAHHRAHGLHHHGEAALAHLRLQQLQHRRHLGHHVLAAGASAESC